MCCLFPNSTNRGTPAPRMTLWEALAEIWRGGRWYDAIPPAHRGDAT